MILFDKKKLLKALNTELDENAELGDVIKFIEDYEKYHSAIRAEGRPLLIVNERAIYLTEGHIEALKEYEKKIMFEEVLKDTYDNIIKAATLELPFKEIKVIDFEKPREEGEE